MTEHVISIDKLTKFYGNDLGINNVTLNVEKGTIHGFLGPNGAGKTTTIRILVGILKPTSGSATIMGNQIGSMKAKKLVSYLPSDFELYPYYTVDEYLNFIASIRGGAPLKAELMNRFDLDGKKLTKDLSRGNRQKVGIVQAFMHRPEIVIADEATTGLDPLMQEEFLHFMKEYVSEGHTIFFSSHLLSEVQQVCDQATVIKEGEIVSSGNIDSLLEKVPQSAIIEFEGEIPVSSLEGLPNVTKVKSDKTKATVFFEGSPFNITHEIEKLSGVVKFYIPQPSLENYFLPIYQKGEI